ncbi:MAG: HAD family hydrolase, partial [Trebonia sp.]
MIRAVFLDVDDTLIDYEPASRAAFELALGDDAPYEKWLTLEHFERWLSGEFSDFVTFRNERMRDFLTLLGREAEAERAAAIEAVRFGGLAERCTLFEDALPALDELRRRDLAIGLITNNEPDHQRGKLAHVGLDKLVDAIVISGELGVAKPDAAI